ncbi:MAG TPA: hypothetical protein VJ912_01925 [Candidatus Nanoarchaeia archaeon]|nr:hypothetical protein [Candidatus Nanoarchaeia archaeon]
MSSKLSCNVSVFPEMQGKKKVYIARCEELGISDHGESVEEAVSNLKKGLNLLIKNDPEKAKPLKQEKPVLTTKIFL